MGEREVKHVAAYISGLTEGIIGLENQVTWASNMLAAYTNEYGENLMKTLSENVVDGEIVDQANVESTKAHECQDISCLDTHLPDSSEADIMEEE